MRILFFLLFSFSAFAQVTTEEIFPTGDKEITLIFDLKLAKDSRASGLLGKTSDVFLWSGAGDADPGDAFKYQPDGQTNFSAPFEKGKMTALGNDKWSIKLNPRTYFNVPAGNPIVKLGLLLKSGDGKAQTEDFVLKLYAGSYALKWLSPAESFTLAEAGSSVNVRAKFSATSSISLKTAGTVLSSSASSDSINYTYSLGSEKGKLHTLILEGTSGSSSLKDSVRILTKPAVVTEALPAGMKDGVNYVGNKVVLCFYAPSTSFVYAIGEFSNWSALPAYLMKRTADGLRYWIDLGVQEAGKEVAYQFWVDGKLAVADPLTEKILDPNNDTYISATTYPSLKKYPTGAKGIVSVFESGATPYVWKTTSFTRPASSNLHVYELLVRDFVADRRYKTVADSLGYLKKLGINALELMPVAEFSGNDSWGYNPIFYTAPDKAYGTKNDLKYLIDKCHENGMAVIMDIVLNQADYENPYVKMYWDGAKPTATSPFFNPSATHPYSVFFDFNHESAHTQWLVDVVTKFWLEEYKIDGYRFDLSKGFTQTPSGSNVDLWGQYDASRVKIWKRIYDKIRSYDASAYVVLEHIAANNEENELGNYGMLLWGNSKFDMARVAQGYTQDLSNASYKMRGFTNPSVMNYIESHDEERLMVEVTNGGKKVFTAQEKLERMKMAAATFLTIPGPKMIWQFGELGYDVSINENGRTGTKPLKWTYVQDSERAKLLKVYQQLGALKLSKPVFTSTDFTVGAVGSVKRNLLTKGSDYLLVLANPDVNSQVVSASFPKTGVWYDYFSGKSFEVKDAEAKMNLLPGEFHLLTNVAWNTTNLGLVPWSIPDFNIMGVESASINVKVYPNPSYDVVQLDWEAEMTSETQLRVVDAVGREVLQKTLPQTKGSNSTTLSTQNIPKGLYYIQIDHSKAKLLKQ
ncbi:alpha-amylase family glycosyl hydrolase [Aquirufa antheringensis]|uniref:alpha-amylase family glycosyl hydrolase n=1 Tax=Aquirufa antheringensis TaxID=2516559 RepID=UPI00103280A5|nr:alpha-amylase family glycosyl hydrolase [Aquirufa antheringensis]MCZ2477337.1 T9SS type A sorting domain-containing protein [Aquirufa antheringensis]TBH70312.1 T9SS type A sorting domain-containing protein [Aquirufa antheringensis]